ncbi:MAG: hypothetical protein ACOY5F_15925 [Pseudomonadota bacterium]|jgi:hypothetical protein
MTVSDARTIKNKVREFRERASKAKLKAAATEEAIARRMFEDAARQFDDMADNLEKHGRTYSNVRHADQRIQVANGPRFEPHS